MFKFKILKSSDFFKDQGVKIPIFTDKVSAGFPSPASDYIEHKLDLNEYLIKHPSATFYVHAKGNSMIEDGIYDGDIMVVDRSLEPKTKDVAIVVLNGEFTVKRILIKHSEMYLIPANKNYNPILITSDADCNIWGIVTHTIHSFK